MLSFKEIYAWAKMKDTFLKMFFEVYDTDSPDEVYQFKFYYVY